VQEHVRPLRGEHVSGGPRPHQHAHQRRPPHARLPVILCYIILYCIVLYTYVIHQHAHQRSPRLPVNPPTMYVCVEREREIENVS
jgi:hypothetical protein